MQLPEQGKEQGGYTRQWETHTGETLEAAAENGDQQRPEPTLLDDVMQEISILCSLRHKSVLSFHEYFVEQGNIYIVTELLYGGELLDALLRMGSYSESEARLIFRQLLAGLAYLHGNHVTHRDLKLENLMLAHKEDLSSLRIADFGLAKQLLQGESAAMDTICGTPMYVAPEVISGDVYAPCVDMWSAGVILFMLLTGTPPFDDRHGEAVLFRQIKAAEFSLNGNEFQNVSKEAKQLILGLMQVDQRRRLLAREALEHRWFKCASQPKRTIQITTLSQKLTKFAEDNGLEERKYEVGDFLIRQGDRAKEMFILQAGTVEILVESGARIKGDSSHISPEYVHIADRGPGDFIGEAAINIKKLEDICHGKVAEPKVADPLQQTSVKVTEAGRISAQHMQVLATIRCRMLIRKFGRRWFGSRRTASVRVTLPVRTIVLGPRDVLKIMVGDIEVQNDFKNALIKRRTEITETLQ